jgi:hypothetical protein
VYRCCHAGHPLGTVYAPNTAFVQKRKPAATVDGRPIKILGMNLFGCELVFANAAQGAFVIFGQIFPLYALSFFVIFVTANFANIFHLKILLFLFIVVLRKVFYPSL